MNKINFIRFSLLLSILMFLTQCNQLDKLTQFELDYHTQVTIPSNLPISVPFNVITPEITTNSTATFESNDTSKDLIEEIRLTQLILTLNSPPNSDFSFLNDVHISLNADGLPEIEVAYLEDISDNPGNQLELTIRCQDLQEYIKKDNFQIGVEIVTDETILQDHEIDIYSVFFVDAEILGL